MWRRCITPRLSGGTDVICSSIPGRPYGVPFVVDDWITRPENASTVDPSDSVMSTDSAAPISLASRVRIHIRSPSKYRQNSATNRACVPQVDTTRSGFCGVSSGNGEGPASSSRPERDQLEVVDDARVVVAPDVGHGEIGRA